MSTRKESRRMKKKYWTTRMLSGVLSAVMVVSVAIIPMTASVAASPRKDEDIGEYVASLADLEDVRDNILMKQMKLILMISKKIKIITEFIKYLNVIIKLLIHQ